MNENDRLIQAASNLEDAHTLKVLLEALEAQAHLARRGRGTRSGRPLDEVLKELDGLQRPFDHDRIMELQADIIPDTPALAAERARVKRAVRRRILEVGGRL